MFQLGAGVGGCKLCNQSVFLAQRLLISGHLFHRTCFKCARCGALLSVANYYETQDGRYCCETCPDEERMVSPSPGDGHVSLVGNRRALFETLAAADYTDDVKASKKAQRPITLKMTDSIVEEKITSDDNDSGVIVSDKKESSDIKTSVSVSGSRETLSDVVVVDEPKEDVLVLEEKTIVSSDKSTINNPIVDYDDVHEPIKSNPVLLQDIPNQSPKEIMKNALVELPRDIQRPLSDDLKQVLECSLGKHAEEHVESPEDLEIKTLTNKLLKMDYYESNKEVPVPSPRKKFKSPIQINYPENLNPFDDEEDDINKDKDNGGNPFGSDIEDEEEPAIKTNVSLKSLNPFSSDEDDEILCRPPLPKPR